MVDYNNSDDNDDSDNSIDNSAPISRLAGLLGSNGLDQNTLSQLSNQQSNLNNNAPNSTSDISDLFNSARQNLNNSNDMGITKDQLDALHKHEGANMWTSMFMNLIGSANNVSAKDSTDILNRSLDNQRANLALQGQAANQQAQRATDQQNFGMGQLRANQALTQQQILNSPISNVQKALYVSGYNAAGMPLNPDDLQNKNQMQFENEFPNIEKLAQIKAQQQMYENRGIVVGRDPWTNEPIIINKNTRDASSVNGTGGNSGTAPSTSSSTGPQTMNQKYKGVDPTTLKFDDSGKIITPPPNSSSNSTQSDTSNPQSQTPQYTYNDLLGPKAKQIFSSPMERDQVIKQLVPLKQEATKLTQDENEYQTAVNQLQSEVGQSLKGNFVASRTLPDREAAVLGGLKQRLSNMQVQMQKDSSSGGVVNMINSTLSKWSGNGPVTMQEAKDILDLTKDIEAKRQDYYERQRDTYRNQAAALFNNKQVNLDPYLFGKTYTPTQSSPQPSGQVTTTPYASLDDYKNSLQNQNSGGQ